MQSSSFTTDIHGLYHGSTLLIHTWLFTHTLGDRLSGRRSFSDPQFKPQFLTVTCGVPQKQQCCIMCTDYTESVPRQMKNTIFSPLRSSATINCLISCLWIHTIHMTYVDTHIQFTQEIFTNLWTHKATGAFQLIQKCLLAVNIWTQSIRFKMIMK